MNTSQMVEYIERKAAIKAVEKADYTAIANDADSCKADYLREIIESVPAADVAPVVRCKDCVHWDDDPDTYGADYGPKGKCMKSFETMCADDFCSYGERKDEGADNA